MEKISYEEAKEWFWVRTFIWLLPCIAVSVAAGFVYSKELIDAGSPRLWVSLGIGAIGTLSGLLSAFFSLQLPWMRTGRWYCFLLTSPVSAFGGGFIAFAIAGAVISLMKPYAANTEMANIIEVSINIAKFFVAGSVFWGFCFGSWFSLRRDKYFIEQI